MDLRPDIAAPIGVTTRLAHTHIDSAHNLYAGLAFDFSHNLSHRKFVVDLFAQPKLREAIRTSTLHQAACSQCGLPIRRDLPLLLYYQDSSRPLDQRGFIFANMRNCPYWPTVECNHWIRLRWSR